MGSEQVFENLTFKHILDALRKQIESTFIMF